MTNYHVSEPDRTATAIRHDIDRLYMAMDAVEDAQERIHTKAVYEVCVRIYHALDRVFTECGFKAYIQRMVA